MKKEVEVSFAKKFLKWGAEAVLTGIALPVAAATVIWLGSFIVSSYKTMADVADLKKSQDEMVSKTELDSLKSDIKEIHTDVRDIRNYLLERK